ARGQPQAHGPRARPAQGPGWLLRPPLRVPRPARAQDPAPAGGPAVRERAGPGRALPRPSQGRARALPGPARAPRPRDRPPPDVGLWRDRGTGAAWRPGLGGALLRRPAPDRAHGQPGRRGIAREPARAHLALRLFRGPAPRGRDRPRPRPHLPGRGGRRRSRGRRGLGPGRGAREGGRGRTVMHSANETMLTVVLGALAVYFSVLNGRGLLHYAQFRRVRPTAVLTWPIGHPRNYSLQLVLGVVSGAVAVLNA